MVSTELKLKNLLTAKYNELENNLDFSFVELYKSFSNEQLVDIFSTLHSNIVSSFKTMNSRLPTKDDTNYFWAANSRELIRYIDIVESLYRSLKNTSLAFEIDKYYQSVILKCKVFLSEHHGSIIPPHMDRIELYYEIPIFLPVDTLEITAPEKKFSASLKLIGEGSYARVFYYVDEYYGKRFVVKRAKADLDEKELQRFRQEFEAMKKLHSPYVVEVYCFDEKKNHYIMEYMDYSVAKYIEKNNTTLSKEKRKALGRQILKAFEYIHSKGLLHRDISPQNVLIKEYEDTMVVKIADFGLVRVPQSELTSTQTEFKGSLNDPALDLEGFKNYEIRHETYALTRLLFFVMTGKRKLEDAADAKLCEFVRKGTHSVKSERFSSVKEMQAAFNVL